jgi:hypothetical protein
MDGVRLAARCGSGLAHTVLATSMSFPTFMFLFLSDTATTTGTVGFLSPQISPLAELIFLTAKIICGN